MKVAVDVTPAMEAGAGIGRYAAELVRALTAIGHGEAMALFSIGGKAPAGRAPFPGVEHRFSTMPSKLWRGLALLSHTLRRSMAGYLPPGTTVFHATDHLLPYLGRVSSVFTLHDMTVFTHPKAHRVQHRLYSRFAMKGFMDAADAVIAISESTKRDAVRLAGTSPEKMTVIPQGVGHQFTAVTETLMRDVKERYALPERYLLAVGTVEPRKNLGLLLDVLREVNRHGREVGLVIAGRRGWRSEGFYRKVEALGLRESVLILGHVPEADLPGIYGAAEALLFPSLYEGFGLPVLEAMAAGAPVLSSNTSSLPEVAGEAAILLPPQDVAGWAEATRAVLSDRALGERLREQGRRRAALFTWERTAQMTWEVYREAESRRP